MDASRGKRTRQPGLIWVVAAGAFVLGTVVAVLVTLAAPPAERTLLVVVGPAQLVTSVLTPLIGILLVRRAPREQLWPPLLRGIAMAAALGAALFLVTLGVVAASPTATTGIDQVGALGAGSVLVQCLALLTGTGLARLIRWAGLAFLATIVIPLGLWWLLGQSDTLVWLRDWLTPYASAKKLLSATMAGLDWFQFAVVVLLWGGFSQNATRVRRG